MANSLNGTYEAQKRQKEAKIEHKSTGVTNSINKASVDAMARADVYSPKSAPVGTDINGRNLIPTQDSYTQAAYEEYLTTGKINPGYTSLVSFDDLEAFGDAHTQKLKDGRSFYSYGTTTILDGYKFDNNALKRSKEMFEDYWDKTGSKSAKWGYDLTDPEDYRRYQEGLPSKKYEEGYGDDPYSLWLKENGLGHADYFMNGSSGYYEQALFEQAELDKQVESTDAFMKEVRRRVKFIADDPFNVTMDEIYRAAEDVRYANPEYRDFSIENPGLAKKTIEDFKDYASPELAYDEYIAGLDKNRGKYGHIYLDTLYTSVTGKPYSSPSSESASSTSSSSSSGNKTAKAEEELYKEVADEFLRSGVTPTSENIDKYIAKVIESDTTGKYDDVKFVEEKDYSDSTWGNVSAARDKSKGITLQEAKEGVIRAYGDMTSTEITAPSYSPEEKAYNPVEQDKEVEVTSQPVSDLQRAIEMVQGYRADGYSEDVIKEFVTSRGLPYQDAVNAVRYQGLWTREAAKQQASTPAEAAPATERTPMQENYDPRTAAKTYIALRDAEEAKLKREAETLAYMQEGASKIITGAIEKEYATPKTREGALGMSDDEYMPSKYRSAVDIAIDDIMSTGASLEEAFALIQADRRLDYRDSTYYKEEQEKIESKIRELADSNAVYQLYLDVENELRQGNNQDIVPLDSVKAATEAYSALRDLGLTNAQIAEQMARHGLRIEDAEGVVQDSKVPEGLDALIDSAVASEEDAKTNPAGTTTYSGVGPSQEVPFWVDTISAVDSVLLSLTEDQGYSVQQALSIIEENGRLKLSDSERYKDEVRKYYKDKRVAAGDYSEAADSTITDIIYRNTAKTNSESTGEKQADARKLSEAAASELYPKVLEAVGGDESLASYYMESLGLDISDVSKIQKEKAAAEKAETERIEREAVEDEWFSSYFDFDDVQSVIKGYNDPTGLYQTLTPKGEEILTSRVSVYRDAMTALGRSQFEIDNALRRNGLGFMISDEESGAHYYEDVLTSIGLDPETAAAVVEMSDSEELREYGEEAKYSPDWENSTLESVENTLIAMGANAALGTLRTIGSIADFLTDHKVEEIDQLLDSIEEKMARFRAAAEDPNHKNAGIAADAGSEVLSIVLTSNTSKFFTKAVGKFGISGVSKVADYMVSSLPYFGRSLGSNYREYIKSGAPVSEAKWGATIAAVFEAVTEESIFSGTLLPKFVERAEDAVRASGMSANIKSGILRYGIPGLRLATYAVGESFEEFESSVFETFARKWTWDDHASVDWGEAGDSARMGAVIGLIYGALGAPAGSARYEMSHDILNKFESAIKANSDAMPYIDLDSLAAVSHVETEVSKERYEKFKTEYEAGTIQPVTEAEFKDAISAVFTSAESSKKESRRYKEKTKSYETEEAVAAKKVESIETQLKGIFASAEARKENGEVPFSVEDAKTVKALFDKLAVAKRDFERVSADVVAKKDTAANDYSSKAQKDKESYMKNRAVVEQYFMQKCFEMDLQLFGEKAEQPAMEAQTAEATGVQPADIEVEQTEQPVAQGETVYREQAVPAAQPSEPMQSVETQETTPSPASPITPVQDKAETGNQPNARDEDGNLILDKAIGATFAKKKPQGTSKTYTNTYEKVLNPETIATDDYDGSYDKQKEEETVAQAKHFIEKRIEIDGTVDKYAEELEYRDAWGAVETDAAMGILAMYVDEAKSSGDYTKLNAWKAVIADHIRENARALQALAKYSRGKGTVVGDVVAIETALNEIIKDYGKRAGKDITVPDDAMKGLYDAETDAERDAALEKIIAEIAKQIPPSIADQINAWRYLAMLGNARTHVRNIVGNASMDGIRRAKNAVGALIESAVVDKDARTKSILNPFSEEDSALKTYAKEAWSEAEKYFGIDKHDSSKKGIIGSIEAKRKSFGDGIGILNWLSSKNSDLLKWEDIELFAKPAFVDAFAQAMKARGLTADTITPEQRGEIMKIAIVEATKSTFRDASKVAAALTKIEKSGILGSLVVGGTVPYKQTPINVLKRGVEYSPIGLLKGLYDVFNGVRKGKVSAVRAIDEISSGLVGTGLATLGVFLAKAGILRAGGDEDETYENYMQDLGAQQYSLCIGDWSVTIDWLTPASMPLFVGAELFFSDVLTGGLNGESTRSIADGLIDALSKVADPLTQLSMLQGINEAISSAAMEDNDARMIAAFAKNAVLGYASQFVPTFVGQISRTIDPVRRTSSGDPTTAWGSNLDYVLRKTANKTPFSVLMEPYVDKWGNEEINEHHWAVRLLENTLLPGYIDKVDMTEVDVELTRLFSAVGNETYKIIPKAPSRKITYDKQTYTLDAEQFTLYKKEYGAAAFDAVEDVISESSYAKKTDEEKAKAVADAISSAGSKVRKNWGKKLKADK